MNMQITVVIVIIIYLTFVFSLLILDNLGQNIIIFIIGTSDVIC